MTPIDVAAITRELLENDPNVVDCIATPQGVQVHVRRLSGKSSLRVIYGYPIEYIEVSGEDT